MLAVRTGLEPATSAVTGRHTNQLYYRTKVGKPKFALYIDIEHRWLNVKSPFFKRASAKVSRFLNIRNTSALKNKKFS